MRLSILAAQCLAATSVLAAPSLFVRDGGDGQEIEAETGDSVSNGPAAVSNPNINNGLQIDSSLIGKGEEGQNIISNVFGASFTNVKSNTANKDNIVINPTTVNTSGNEGSTANGKGNNIGDSNTVVPGLRRRDVRAAGGVLESYYVQPVYAHAPIYAAPGPAIAFPNFGYGGPYAGHANYNFQDASIVQNQGHGRYY
ncbi:hypothetical protein GGI25_003663 [Coemansia spiralis]|uniref:Uncharacterized protein n=2 Tax=Coemansia TaxID=4863 RepID=A0A9W8KXS7_9FUNG|nr:hypothetical protein BX070DRAFT_224095 [Coemansia spiralis]KAJ1986153.1 hypothetical protein EDC05_006396 [Coemansia umbellata]KAJ2618736.1 hypothetical protein GGI26_006382 [Coemansia sp. RSA 1358]KAJ2676158.1 hypothetical protein GGI25_003663 [Coemansia spiralis]